MSVAQPIRLESKRGGPTDPSHDERLRRGIIETRVSRGVALAMVVAFLGLIYAIPVSQALLEKKDGQDVLLADLFRHAPTKQRLHQFEDDLEQASYAKAWTQPRLQAALTALGRVGNKKAVVGRDGWLYYKPGITYVGGPGFLEPEVLDTRARAALEAGEPPVAPDPRVAILAFARALARRGIGLVVFPVPDKATLQPRQLHGRGDALPRNPDDARFAAELRAAGIAVFDPMPMPMPMPMPAPAPASPGAPSFLRQDTHWMPAFMEECARGLARVVKQVGGASLAPLADPPRLHRVGAEVARLGDLVDMLKLPDAQKVFVPQRVFIHEVRDAANAEWEPDPKADVLLLGDSFTNVFSLEPMGWGVSAGLAPQLAFALGRGVDVIAQNDSGAFATRQALARELAADDRLAGKRVVVWEFAARELAVGDWKPIDWDAVLGERR